MKKLNEVIQYKKFIYEKIYEDDKWYVYSQSDPKYGFIGYEVFKKKINTQYNTESWPSEKAFGIWAWSCKSIDTANKIMGK